MSDKTSIVDEYVPRDEAIEYGKVHFGGKGRALVSGFRVAEGEPDSTEIAGVQLRGGTELPERFGGGFLFWSQEGFSRTKSFTGPLTLAGALPFRGGQYEIADFRFGDSLILFHLSHGGHPDAARFAWSPLDGRLAPMPVPGLLDVAVLPDGRSAMFKEPFELWVRAAGAKNYVKWNDPQLKPGGLSASAERITVLDTDARRYVVDARGRLAPVEPELVDPYPLFAHGKAFAEGAPLGGDDVALIRDNALVRANLRARSVVETIKLPVPHTSHCELHPIPEDVLAFCTTPSSKFVVLSGLSRMKPKKEWSFDEARPQFFAGMDGSLLMEGPCSSDTDASPAALCIRHPSGTWRTLGIPTELAKPGPSPNAANLSVERWIPTQGGGALGIILGDHPRAYDTASRKYRTLHADARELARVISHASDMLDAQYIVLPDGSIAGYARSGPRQWASDGTLKKPSAAIQNLSFKGAHALGRDGVGQLWQSVNYGLSWDRVHEPRQAYINSSPISGCFLAGCTVGDWYRIGYPTVHAEHPPTALIYQTSVPRESILPRLECESRGPALRAKVAEVREKSGVLLRAWGLGASLMSVDRGFAQRKPYAAVPGFWRSEHREADCCTQAQTFFDFDWPETDEGKRKLSFKVRRSLQYQYYFARPRVETAVIDWGALGRATASAGDEQWQPPIGPGGVALPILSNQPGTTDGLILLSMHEPTRWGIWISRERPPSIHAVAQHPFDGTISSSARSGGHLYYLEQRSAGSELREFGGETQLLLEAKHPPSITPPQPDVISLGPNGELGILRLWSLWPATQDDPALVLTANKAPQALAPWSTLRAGPCDGEQGFRAIVKVNRWLGYKLQGTPALGTAMALVHWNEHRVCLEAVEIPINDDLLVARFGKKAEAYLYRFDEGSEFIQPEDCRLVLKEGDAR